jgi:hypothetical protein
MAKKKDIETEIAAVAVVEPQAVVAQSGTVLPSLAGASPELQERMLEVKENMESVESFRLPRAKMTAEGFELIEGEDVVTELEGVILHTKKTNVYYAKPYNPNDVTPPDCFSLDGNKPDASVAKPVSPACKGCPMAEFGTNSMKSGKACRNLKPMYLLLSDEAIMPRQLTITPASLKAANQYLMDLTERGIAYRKVKTKIIAYKEDKRDTYMKLRFVMGSRLDEQQQKNVEFLKNQWRPVMDNQMIDQREVDNGAGVAVAASNGEF